MTYGFVITKDAEVVAERDISADEVIAILAKFTTAEVASERGPSTLPRRGLAAKDDRSLRPAGVRRHPLTEKIEELLIEGRSVAEITEQCEASAPTIYTIKARLKKEGRL
jgi:hypothetical protein